MQAKYYAAMNRKKYREMRRKIGRQFHVAKLLGVAPNTISRRETGTIPITREAALALRLMVLQMEDGK